MSVRFICGLPGGGKSTYAVMMLVRELKQTMRPIITNLPLDVGRLNEYMQEKEPGRDCAVLQRVRLITVEEVRQWWIYRGRDIAGNWLTLQGPGEKEAETDFVPLTESVRIAKETHDGVVYALKETASSTGACYFLDEVHTVFNARRWMATGPGALWYLSQHRKLGDDVWLISQRPQQVDKQLKMLSEEYIKLTNLRKRKFLQIFRMPRKFVHHHYYDEPDRQTKPEVTGIFSLDATGIGTLFDTAAGNGLQGNGGADKGEKVRGVPWYALGLLPLLIPLGFWCADHLAAFGLNKVANLGMRSVPGAQQALAQPHTAQVTNAPPVVQPFATTVEPSNALAMDTQPTVNDSPVCGWMKVGHSVTAYRMDGSTVTVQDGLSEVARSYIVVNGKREPITSTRQERHPTLAYGPEVELAQGTGARSPAKRGARP